MTEIKIADFLIRILKDKDKNHRKSLGCGFFTQNDYLVTCAHVITDEYGPVYLDFPFISSDVLTADVVRLFPVKNDPSVEDVEDIALLKLAVGQALPKGAKPALLVFDDEELVNQNVKMWGFHESDKAGMPVEGELKGVNAMGYIHMNHELGRQYIEKGFSGTPVWLKDKKTVAGIIVSKRERKQITTANVIPVTKIRKAISTVEVMSKSEIARPIPFVNSSEIIQPGAAIDKNSDFYIRRKCDYEVFNMIDKSRGVANLRGASQTGKTSLMVRIHAKTRLEKNLRSVFIDFEGFEEGLFQTLSILWKTIISEIARQLSIDEWLIDSWYENMPYERNILLFLDKYVFFKDPRPLLLCLDEVNQLFAYHVKDAFFKSVRSLYDKGAHDDTCKNIRWILSTSSEPGFFIEDLNGSPFNICEPVIIHAFSNDETSEFANRYGLSLEISEIEEINKYVGSRPYLIHLLLHHLATRNKRLEVLLDPESAGGGVFLEHLNRYLKQFQEEPDLKDAMLDVITGRGCEKVVMASRLEAAGLALYNEKQKLVSSCGLYTGFFRGKL